MGSRVLHIRALKNKASENYEFLLHVSLESARLLILNTTATCVVHVSPLSVLLPPPCPLHPLGVVGHRDLEEVHRVFVVLVKAHVVDRDERRRA